MGGLEGNGGGAGGADEISAYGKVPASFHHAGFHRLQQQHQQHQHQSSSLHPHPHHHQLHSEGEDDEDRLDVVGGVAAGRMAKAANGK